MKFAALAALELLIVDCRRPTGCATWFGLFRHCFDSPIDGTEEIFNPLKPGTFLFANGPGLTSLEIFRNACIVALYGPICGPHAWKNYDRIHTWTRAVSLILTRRPDQGAHL